LFEDPCQVVDSGTHTVAKGCLYVKRLSDINLDVLERVIKTAFTARNNLEGA
jgi:hypothetical protein